MPNQPQFALQVHSGHFQPLLIDVPSLTISCQQLYNIVKKPYHQLNVEAQLDRELPSEEMEPLKKRDESIELYYKVKKIPESDSVTLDSLNLPFNKEDSDDACLMLYIANPTTHQMMKSIQDYIDDKSNTTPLKFPTTFTSLQRKFIHSLAAECGLHHQSSGKRASRYVLVSKGRNRTVSASVTKKVPIERHAKKIRSTIEKGAPTAILEWLYLGSGLDANAASVRERFGISAILNVTSDWNAPKNLDDSILYKRLPLLDVEEANIGDSFKDAIAFLNHCHENNHTVLVHCAVGKSRSATIVIAYMMFINTWDLAKAHAYVKGKRELIRPNNGFIQQLQTFERTLFPSLPQPSLVIAQLEKPLYKNQKTKAQRREESAKLFEARQDVQLARAYLESNQQNFVQHHLTTFDHPKTKSNTPAFIGQVSRWISTEAPIPNGIDRSLIIRLLIPDLRQSYLEHVESQC